MVLIDTSVWIEFLRSGGAPSVKRLIRETIERSEAAYTCPVLYELLYGARPHEVGGVRTALSYCTRHEFLPQYWEGAGELGQKLLRSGAAMSQGDVLIAYVAIELQLPLMSRDKHFNYVKKVVGSTLELVQLT